MKIVSIALAAAMTALFAALPAGVFASGVLSLSVSDAMCAPGDSAVLSLDMTENTGLYSFWSMIYFDPGVLTLTDVAFGEGISMRGTFFTSPVLTEEELFGPAASSALEKLDAAGVDTSGLAFRIIMFEANDPDFDLSGYGNLALLSFGVSSDAEDGVYTVGIIDSDENAIDCESRVLDVSLRCGSVKVETPVIPGDVNADRAVDVKDILALRRVIALLDDVDEKGLVRADLTCDSHVDMKDVALLMKTIS
ncbi:MAG: hypothetical protein IKN38_01770 [Clostridia bacterium]|nr:hypothetical protein [Clostridia bacterium]